MKVCSRCKVEQPLAAFPRERATPDGRYRFCSLCSAKASATWRMANPERSKATTAAYRSRPDVKERSRERDRKRPAEQKRAKDAAYRERHRAELRARQLKYHHEHPDVAARAYAKRRAAKAVDGAGLTKAEWDGILSDHANCCRYCGDGESKLTMDHVVPLSRGGLHVAANIVPACDPCNKSKGNRLLSEWKYDRS